MKVTSSRIVLALGLACAALYVAGCGDSVPENSKPADGSNPHVQGSPEDRIKAIEADTSLAPEERARRIAVVKERNHIK